MKTVQDVRLNNINSLLRFVSRSWLSEMVGVEYNHLNQYLGKNPKKSVGGIVSARISQGLSLPSNWLDVARNRYEILNALGLGFNQDSSLINSDSLYVIKGQYGMPFCDLQECLGLDTIKIERFAKIKPLLLNHVFFRLDYSSPITLFRNGIICCSGELVPGSQSLFLFEDGTVLFAEYIYGRDGYMNLLDESGVRKDFCMNDLIYGSQITLVLQ